MKIAPRKLLKTNIGRMPEMRLSIILVRLKVDNGGAGGQKGKTGLGIRGLGPNVRDRLVYELSSLRIQICIIRPSVHRPIGW